MGGSRLLNKQFREIRGNGMKGEKVYHRIGENSHRIKGEDALFLVNCWKKNILRKYLSPSEEEIFVNKPLMKIIILVLIFFYFRHSLSPFPIIFMD